MCYLIREKENKTNRNFSLKKLTFWEGKYEKRHYSCKIVYKCLLWVLNWKFWLERKVEVSFKLNLPEKLNSDKLNSDPEVLKKYI